MNFAENHLPKHPSQKSLQPRVRAVGKYTGDIIWHSFQVPGVSISGGTVDGSEIPNWTTWDVRIPINNGINCLLTGAGFLPSTVCPTFILAADFFVFRGFLKNKFLENSRCDVNVHQLETLQTRNPVWTGLALHISANHRRTSEVSVQSSRKLSCKPLGPPTVLTPNIATIYFSCKKTLIHVDPNFH